MRILLLPAIIWIVLNVGVDWYIFRAIAIRLNKSYVVKWAYMVASILALVAAIVGISLPLHTGGDAVLRAINWLLFIYLTVYVPKYLFLILDLLSCIPRLFGGRRIKWISKSGAFLSIALFFVFWWGALVNRYMINVKEVPVEILDLPEVFDGYRIVQFSDFHVGTYGTDTTFVAKAVDRINGLKPDAVFFTGDIVNRHTEELLPFVGTLSRLNAPDGVTAILGNHDYGDYYKWKSTDDKAANMEMLKSLYHDMGWTLLLNETEWLKKGNDSIAIIGVENIGEPPFRVYGSLLDSYSDLSDKEVKILLSHNPAHWVDSIADNPDINIPLTLSGHTHAMQVVIAGWSPSAWKYKTWGGMYVDKNDVHSLYVNIGLGEVGLPMRIGATPELTVITLKRKEN